MGRTVIETTDLNVSRVDIVFMEEERAVAPSPPIKLLLRLLVHNEYKSMNKMYV